MLKDACSPLQLAHFGEALHGFSFLTNMRAGTTSTYRRRTGTRRLEVMGRSALKTTLWNFFKLTQSKEFITNSYTIFEISSFSKRIDKIKLNCFRRAQSFGSNNTATICERLNRILLWNTFYNGRIFLRNFLD